MFLPENKMGYVWLIRLVKFLVYGLSLCGLVGCAGARGSLVFNSLEYPVSMSGYVENQAGQSIPPEEMEVVGKISYKKTFWGLLYGLIRLTNEQDASQPINRQIRDAGGDGARDVSISVENGPFNEMPIFNMIPFWPGITRVIIKGDIIKFQPIVPQPAPLSSIDSMNPPEPETITDADNNVYHIVKIGNQLWTAENLGTTKYNDGAPIPIAPSVWENSTSGGYCWYNEGNNFRKKKKYGALYNWYAVNTRKLAPKGWHVPTAAEWDTLRRYVLSKDVLISKSGFSALPAGECTGAGFVGLGSIYSWWSSTAQDSTCAHYYYWERRMGKSVFDYHCCLPVRLIKDN